jgi:amino acid transporter
MLDVLTLLKGLPLLLLALWGLFAAGAIPAPGSLPPLSGIEAAALVVLYAFIGFENSVVPAGETANPGRNIPRALLATIAGTAALYFVVQLAYVSVMPQSSASQAPLVAFATELMGPVGGLLMIGVALCSIAGNTLGSLVSTPRVPFALAGDGLLPRWFGHVSERYRTPMNAVLFTGGIGLLLALTGSFVWLAIVSTLARLIVYAVSIAALWPTQRRVSKRNGFGTIALMTVALSICLWAALQSQWRSWRMLLLLVAVGSVLYVVARWRARAAA